MTKKKVWSPKVDATTKHPTCVAEDCTGLCASTTGGQLWCCVCGKLQPLTAVELLPKLEIVGDSILENGVLMDWGRATARRETFLTLARATKEGKPVRLGNNAPALLTKLLRKMESKVTVKNRHSVGHYLGVASVEFRGG